MARSPDALEFRRWALDWSPPVLRRKALRHWEALLPVLAKRVSPFLLERWPAGIFGEERDKERQKYDDDFKRGFAQRAMLEELFYMALFAERLTEAVGVPVVCDRPPYEVAVGHAHLFDFLPSFVRQTIAATSLSESERTDLRGSVKELLSVPPEEIIRRFTAARPIMDRAVPLALKASDGYAIHCEQLRHWIVFNARMARYAAVGADQQAARESLEKICGALLPPPLTAKGPNEASLAIDYRFIRGRADPVLKKNYNIWVST